MSTNVQNGKFTKRLVGSANEKHKHTDKELILS